MSVSTSLPKSSSVLWLIAWTIASPSLGTAQFTTFNDGYKVPGFSQPYRISNVASPISGIIQTLEVRAGDRVAQGDCIVTLDRSVHDKKLELARIAKDSLGELQATQAELASQTTRLRRIRELAERKHATAVELLQAEEDRAVALAGVQRAQERLAQQAADYARLVAESRQFSICAPFDGVVMSFNKQLGEHTGPGDATVCTIADLDTLSIEFLVPRHYRHNLTREQQIEVLFMVADRRVTGTVEYISPFPNGETNTYTVKVRVDNSDGELIAGERCQITGANAPLPSQSPLQSRISMEQH